MNKDKIKQRISVIEQELVQLRQKLNDEPQFLFADRLDSYTLDEIHEIVRDNFYPAEFEVRSAGAHAYNGIYLGSGCDKCPWEIVKDSNDAWVLVLACNK